MSDCITERVLIEWGEAQSGNLCYLGSAEDDLEMTIRLDTETKSELLLWFRLPVKVKLHPQARNSRQRFLFFVIQADVFDCGGQEPCLSIQASDSFEISQSTTLALAHVDLFPYNAVSRLRFKLRTPGKVFMPKTEQPLIPTSEKASDALAALQDLSQAKDFRIYVMLKETYPLFMNGNEEMPSKLLMNLCEKVSAGEMKNHVTNSMNCEGYSDNMTCNAWENFDLHRNIRPFQRQQQKGTLACKEQALDFPPPLYNEAISSNTNNKEIERAEALELEVKYISDNGDEHVDTEEDACGQTSEIYLPLDLDLDQEEVETEDDDDLDIPISRSSKPSLGGTKRKGSLDNMQRSSIKKISKTSGTSTLHGPKKVRFIEPVKDSKLLRSQHISKAGTIRFHNGERQNISSTLRAELVEFMHWTAKVDPKLEKHLEKVLWSLGEAASCGNVEIFRRIKFDCKAEILCSYRQREM